MKIAYLILAHKNSSQLIDLIELLDNKNVCFFIHVDARSDIMENLSVLEDRCDVFFLKSRKNIYLSGYNSVIATLLLLEECLNKSDADYISLHSGQDLPIKSNDKIIEYMEANQGLEFIEFFKLPSKFWGGGLERIEYYWFRDDLRGKDARKLAELQQLVGLKREYIKGVEPYGGSQWWTISRGCAEYVLKYTKENDAFCTYYRFTLVPNEMFFQTIILNSDYKKNVVNNNLRYIDWSAGEEHPKTLIFKEDYSKLVLSNRLFARKFDSKVDKKIIKKIKRRIK